MGVACPSASALTVNVTGSVLDRLAIVTDPADAPGAPATEVPAPGTSQRSASRGEPSVHSTPAGSAFGSATTIRPTTRGALEAAAYAGPVADAGRHPRVLIDRHLEVLARSHRLGVGLDVGAPVDVDQQIGLHIVGARVVEHERGGHAVAAWAPVGEDPGRCRRRRTESDRQLLRLAAGSVGHDELVDDQARPTPLRASILVAIWLRTWTMSVMSMATVCPAGTTIALSLSDSRTRGVAAVVNFEREVEHGLLRERVEGHEELAGPDVGRTDREVPRRRRRGRTGTERLTGRPDEAMLDGDHPPVALDEHGDDRRGEQIAQLHVEAGPGGEVVRLQDRCGGGEARVVGAAASVDRDLQVLRMIGLVRDEDRLLGHHRHLRSRRTHRARCCPVGATVVEVLVPDAASAGRAASLPQPVRGAVPGGAERPGRRSRRQEIGRTGGGQRRHGRGEAVARHHGPYQQHDDHQQRAGNRYARPEADDEGEDEDGPAAAAAVAAVAVAVARQRITPPLRFALRIRVEPVGAGALGSGWGRELTGTTTGAVAVARR